MTNVRTEVPNATSRLSRPVAVRRQFKILLIVTSLLGAMTLEFAPQVAAESTPSAPQVTLAKPTSLARTVAAKPVSRSSVRFAATRTTTVAVRKVSRVLRSVQTQHAVRESETQAQSATNPIWSGYVAFAPRFSAVSGDWTVPNVSCSSQTGQWGSQWIGVGGYHDVRLLQLGTDADCLDGSPTYYPWYEVHGQSGDGTGFAEVVPPAASYTVSAGDHMHASITLSTPRQLVLSDLTAGWTYSALVHASTDFGSVGCVEWITEDEPASDGVSQGQLPNFGSVVFSNASAIAFGHTNTISALRHLNLSLVFDGHRLDATSALDPTGAGFFQKWIATI